MLTSYCAASTNWLVATVADRLAEELLCIDGELYLIY